MSDLLKHYSPSRNLRLSDVGLLAIPPSNKQTFSDRASSVAATVLWNSLPSAILQIGIVIINVNIITITYIVTNEGLNTVQTVRTVSWFSFS